MDNDCISVFNNESGFEEKNVRALCDVGQSTKGKHKFGYIGMYSERLLVSKLESKIYYTGTKLKSILLFQVRKESGLSRCLE